MRHKSNGAGRPAGSPSALDHDLPAGKPSLTVFCCNKTLSWNISASARIITRFR